MAFESIARENYVSLTTFRRDGRPVPTPVQFVVDGDRLLIVTGARTGKVKRLRHTPHATIAACDMRGRPKKNADSCDVSVGFDAPAEFVRADELMKRKYGLPQRVLAPLRRAVERLLGRNTDVLWLELRLA